MSISPLMVTAKDDDLLGVSNRSDAMDVLAIWSVRGRDLVPHQNEPLNPQYLSKKQSVFQKISAFVEKFKGVGGEV